MVAGSSVKVSVVIPTLNEEGSIGGVLEGVLPFADEIIVVDGHSTDKTVEVAKSLGAKVIFDDVGKGSAVRKGFAEASGEFVVMMDGDGSHSPQEIASIVAHLGEGYDVVMPSRFMKGGGSEDITPLRRFGNDFYRFWVRLLWGVSYSDICYGFRGFRKEAIKIMGLSSNGFDLELEIAIKSARKRLKWVEIPSVERRRLHGLGKLGFWTSLILDRRVILELLGL